MRSVGKITFLAFVLGGCSGAAWDGDQYGPINSGLVGSAYGYAEQPLGNKRFRVSYSDVGHDRALSRAYRRSAELCASVGAKRFAAGNVSVRSQFGIGGAIDVANVDAKCGGGRVSVSAQSTAPLAQSTRENKLATGPVVASATGFNSSSFSEPIESTSANELTVEQLTSDEFTFGDEAEQKDLSSVGAGTEDIGGAQAASQTTIRGTAATGCSPAEVRKFENMVDTEGKRRATGGAGTAVLTAEWAADQLIPVYRQCGLTAKLNQVLEIKAWAVEQRANLGLN